MFIDVFIVITIITFLVCKPNPVIVVITVIIIISGGITSIDLCVALLLTGFQLNSKEVQ